MNHLLRFSPWAVIQALTASATLMWVLETDSSLEPQSESVIKFWQGSGPVTEAAKELAVRLTDVLDPLLVCLDTWRKTDGPWHVEKASEYALKIKADLRLETGDYRVLMYRPGALFNKETMLTYPGSGVQGRYIAALFGRQSFHSFAASHPSRHLLRYPFAVRRQTASLLSKTLQDRYLALKKS